MALTLETTINSSALRGGFPSGYTAPATTLTFTSPSSVSHEATVASAGISDASTGSTGLTNLVAAVDTYVSGTLIPTTWGIDVAGNTVNAIATIDLVRRGNSQDDIFVTGTDQYSYRVIVQFEVS